MSFQLLYCELAIGSSPDGTRLTAWGWIFELDIEVRSEQKANGLQFAWEVEAGSGEATSAPPVGSNNC
jgi:hypothetical protein